MFTFIDVPRTFASAVEGTRNLHDRATVNWASIQAHQRMRELVESEFKTHHVIVKELSLFMLTERVDPADLIKMETDLKKAKEAAVISEKKATDAENKVKAMGLELKTIQSDLKQLTNAFNQYKQNNKKRQNTSGTSGSNE